MDCGNFPDIKAKQQRRKTPETRNTSLHSSFLLRSRNRWDLSHIAFQIFASASTKTENRPPGTIRNVSTGFTVEMLQKHAKKFVFQNILCIFAAVNITTYNKQERKYELNEQYMVVAQLGIEIVAGHAAMYHF